MYSGLVSSRKSNQEKTTVTSTQVQGRSERSKEGTCSNNQERPAQETQARSQASRRAPKTAPEVKYLRDIAPKMAQDYAGKLIRNKATPNTFNKHTGFLKLFFNVLKEDAKLTANPFEKIKRKKQKVDPLASRAPTKIKVSKRKRKACEIRAHSEFFKLRLLKGNGI